MENIKNIFTKLKEIFTEKQNKKAAVIFIIGITGIMLVFLSEIIPDNAATERFTPDNGNPDIFEMEKQLENRLETIISNIDGAGKTKVMLTFDSSKEYFYAQDISENIDEAEISKEVQMTIIEGEKSEEPVTLKTIEAKIRGVIIVCEGGGYPVVREKIIEAVCALLDISSNKVSVTKLA